jgi:hypothetical protein
MPGISKHSRGFYGNTPGGLNSGPGGMAGKLAKSNKEKNKKPERKIAVPLSVESRARLKVRRRKMKKGGA